MTRAQLAEKGIAIKSLGRAGSWARASRAGRTTYFIYRNGRLLGSCVGSSTRYRSQSGSMTAYKALSKSDDISQRPWRTFESTTEAATALDKATPVIAREAVHAALVRELRQLGPGTRVTAQELADEIVSVDGGPCYPWGRPVSRQEVASALSRLYRNGHIVKPVETPGVKWGSEWEIMKAVMREVVSC